MSGQRTLYVAVNMLDVGSYYFVIDGVITHRRSFHIGCSKPFGLVKRIAECTITLTILNEHLRCAIILQFLALRRYGKGSRLFFLGIDHAIVPSATSLTVRTEVDNVCAIGCYRIVITHSIGIPCVVAGLNLELVSVAQRKGNEILTLCRCVRSQQIRIALRPAIHRTYHVVARSRRSGRDVECETGTNTVIAILIFIKPTVAIESVAPCIIVKGRR